MMVAPEDEMIHANPQVAPATCDLVPVYKQDVEIEGGHFGLIHNPRGLIDKASAIQREFPAKQLR